MAIEPVSSNASAQQTNNGKKIKFEDIPKEMLLFAIVADKNKNGTLEEDEISDYEALRQAFIERKALLTQYPPQENPTATPPIKQNTPLTQGQAIKNTVKLLNDAQEALQKEDDQSAPKEKPQADVQEDVRTRFGSLIKMVEEAEKYKQQPDNNNSTKQE